MPYVNRNTPAASSNVIKTEDSEMNDITNTDEKKTPAWLTRIKEGGVKKIPKDVQKRRRNFRLKKMLTPKPPMMVLFELVQPSEVNFQNCVQDPMSRLFKVTATYDGNQFEGIGPSKSIAKNICSEHILQHIAFKACSKDEQENDTGMEGGNQNEEETPWMALASVALFKLFNDWQAQGAVLPAELMNTRGKQITAPANNFNMDTSAQPEIKTEPMTGQPQQKKAARESKPKAPKTLPENPTSRHPVQLLNEMEGQLEYITRQEGIPPNTTYVIDVTLNGYTYSGNAKNKKEAKKICAQNALANVYDVHYPQ